MDTHLPILTTHVFRAQEIDDTTAYSPAVSLVNAQSNGYFSIQLLLTGDGTLADLFYQVTIDGINFLKPVSASSIATTFTKTSGTGSNGRDIIAFNPELGVAIRFGATVSGTATLSAMLCMQ